MTAQDLNIFVNITPVLFSAENISSKTNVTDADMHMLKYLATKFTSKTSDSLNENFVIIIIYSLIVLISIFGNFLVLLVIYKNKRMRTKTNIFMANITISDIMMTMINIPFNVVRIIMSDWPFGVVLCKLLPAIQVTSVYVSTFIMTIIAIDRYQAINTRFYQRLSNVVPIRILTYLIWIIAGLFSIPELVFNRQVEYKMIHMTRCNTVYPEPKHYYKRIIILLTFSTQYLIPLVITTVMYIKIMNTIHRKYRRRDHDIQKRIKKTDRKIIKMLTIVVLVFTICWLPLNLFHIYAVFSDKLVRYNSALFYSCHMLAMSSVIYNPFIYFGLNKHFRNEIKNIFKCFCGADDQKTTSNNSSINKNISRQSSRLSENNKNPGIDDNYDCNNLLNNISDNTYLNLNTDNNNNSLQDVSLKESIVTRNLIEISIL